MQTLTLSQFMLRTAGMVAEVHVATQHALEKAARVVEQEAKSEIGHYQSAIGPFGDWQELAQSTKDQRVALGFSENDPGLRTGEMRESIQHKVEQIFPASGVAHIGSDDDKLVFFELGTSKQPPRSVLGGAAMRKENEVRSICGEAVVAALMGQKLF